MGSGVIRQKCRAEWGHCSGQEEESGSRRDSRPQASASPSLLSLGGSRIASQTVNRALGMERCSTNRSSPPLAQQEEK